MDQTLYSKIFKFAVVGFSAFIIDFGITYIFKEKFKFNKYLANFMGFLFAASFNFTLNRIWTFTSQDTGVALQALKFAASMSVGLGIASALIYLFSDRLNLNFYFSKLIAVAVVMVWNFTINNYLIFNH